MIRIHSPSPAGGDACRDHDDKEACSTRVLQHGRRSGVPMNHELNLDSPNQNPRRPQPAGAGFVGGYTRGVTPVPIPNTAVKPAGPMILRQRESRSLPALNENPSIMRMVEGFFFARRGGFSGRVILAVGALRARHAKSWHPAVG